VVVSQAVAMIRASSTIPVSAQSGIEASSNPYCEKLLKVTDPYPTWESMFRFRSRPSNGFHRIDKLNPHRIVIVGGTGLVSNAVTHVAANRSAESIARLGGSHRYARRLS
jgi:hypothetical protein